MDDITPQQVLAEVVAALRSGDFLQTTGTLRADDEGPNGTLVVGHCCLGVMCEVGIQHGLIKRLQNSYRWVGASIIDDWRDCDLPSEYAEWLGFDSSDPRVDERSSPHTLSGLNDSGEYDFNEIAAIIEKRFLTHA